MNFKLWFELTDPIKSRWINPDHSYNYFRDDPRTHSFIYTSKGQMYYGRKTHYEIMRDNNLKDKERDILANHDLLGRVGPIDNFRDFATKNGNKFLVVSFWGTNEDLFNNHLIPCLQKLQTDGLIDMNRDAISTINHGTVFIRDLTAANKATDKEIEFQRIMSQLHLMKPQEKRNAMQKLGLAVGNQKNPWQTAADSSGLTKPGQRIWAMNSEHTS